VVGGVVVGCGGGLGGGVMEVFSEILRGVALIRTSAPLNGGTWANNSLVRWEAVAENFF